jgi:hypothetical protein
VILASLVWTLFFWTWVIGGGLLGGLPLLFPARG